MGAGRPTDLTPELIEKARGYLATCVDDLSDLNRKVVNLPMVAGLALFLRCSRDSVYEWAKKNKDFSDIVDEILSSQEERLAKGGISGVYNPTISKLLLAKHGYHDKAEVDHKNDGGKFEAGALSPAMMEATRAYEEAMKKALLNDS